MACGSCVEDLARRLVTRHRIDWILALCLAEKAIERVETRRKTRVRPYWFQTNFRATIFQSALAGRFVWIGRHVGPGKNPNYTQLCIAGGSITCYTVSHACTTPGLGTQCVNTQSCTCTCPAPLSNSSQVSGCSSSPSYQCLCSSAKKCGGESEDCSCGSGTCGYNCNTGYTWNGSQCVTSVVGETPRILKIAGISIFTALAEIVTRLRKR